MDHLSTTFDGYCVSEPHDSAKCIGVCLIIIRMEGKVLCLAKHCFTENRKLTPVKLQKEFQAYASV